MSKVQFVKVDIADWDNDKLEIEPKGEKSFTITYEGKIPILKIIGPRGKEAYFLTSKDGLAKQDTYDNFTGKYRKGEWNGTWGLSFKLTDSLPSIRPPSGEEEDKRSEVDKLKWKLIEIKQYIADTIKEMSEKPVADVFSRKTIIEETTKIVNKKEVKQTVKRKDDNGYAYVNVKVGYDAPKECPTKKDSNGKDVPENEFRTPKGKYYDTARAKGAMQVTDPDNECGVPMRSAVDTTIYVTWAQEKFHVNLNLLNLYYEQDDSLADQGDSIDDVVDRISSERELMDSLPL